MSSGTFLMSLALPVTSCYMKNFGQCTVFSFQLFCIAEEDTIPSAVGEGFLGSWLAFLHFFLLPLCVCALLMDDGAVTGGGTVGRATSTTAVPGEGKRKELWFNSPHCE